MSDTITAGAGTRGQKSVQTIFSGNMNLILWSLYTIVLIILFFLLSDEIKFLISDKFSIGFMGRIFQFTFILIATILPVLMYFLFTRRQYPKIKETFISEVMLLDPEIKSNDRQAAENKYVPRLEEIYGIKNDSSTFLRTLPLYVCTLLSLMGWILVLQPLGSSENLQFSELFLPRPNTVSFAFLGSYFFTINLIFKRYVRDDLTPKTYTHIIVRIILAFILAWILTIVFDMKNSLTDSTVQPIDFSTGLLYIFAFFIGFFPESGLTIIRDLLDNSLINKIFPRFEETHPLTKLEGVNLYDRTRFSEEGIENVENLAHHNLINLMLSVRIPTNRLVDLFDQAILYLHVGTESDDNECSLKQLRRYGIRTASDLEAANDDAKSTDQDYHGKFLKLLDKPNDVDSVSKLQTVLSTLKDDDWMPYIRKWREFGEDRGMRNEE